MTNRRTVSASAPAGSTMSEHLRAVTDVLGPNWIGNEQIAMLRYPGFMHWISSAPTISSRACTGNGAPDDDRVVARSGSKPSSSASCRGGPKCPFCPAGGAAAPHGAAARALNGRSVQVEAVELHHFRPRSDEVVDELLLRVSSSSIAMRPNVSRMYSAVDSGSAFALGPSGFT